MKMEKRTFRIGHLAEDLGLERFVIRFWEREFNIEPERSDGGQRYYTQADAHTFMRIKELLYDQGLTIAGAKKVLKSDKLHEHREKTANKESLFATSTRTVIVEPENDTLRACRPDDSNDMIKHMCELKEKLEHLRKML